VFVVFFAAMAVGFTMMVLAARRAVDSAVELVAGTRVPPFVIGMTILAVGTDLPEIANSVVASWTDHGDVNVGDSVGSAATQITLVLGLLPFFVGTIAVTARGLAATGWLAVGGLGTVALLTADDWFSRTDAMILIGLWAIGSWITYRHIRHPHQLTLPEQGSPRGRLIVQTIVALGIVGAASMLALWGLVELAEEWSAPEFAMSFFLAALGTSLPELIFAITAVRRGEVDMAVGDLFGSSFADATLSVATGPLFFPVAVTASEVVPATVAALVAISGVTILITRVSAHDWRTGSLLVIGYGAFFLVLI